MTWKLLTAFRKIDPKEVSELKIDYDKISKVRPAWVHVKNSDGLIGMIGLTGGKGKRTIPYRVYLRDTFPLFLPTDYTPEEMRKFYDKFSESYDAGVKEKNTPATQLLFKELYLHKKSKILELGAGTGLTAVPFAKAGHEILLVDFSEEMLKLAKKRPELKHCRFKRADVRDLNLKEKFDAVLSIFSFGSNSYFKIAEMNELYALVSKMLSPKGKMALLGHDFEPPASMFFKIKSGIYNTGDKHPHKWAIWEKT